MGLKLRTPVKSLLAKLGKALVNKYADQAVDKADHAIDAAADTAKDAVKKGVERLK